MKKYGYVRVSSKDQNPDRQVDAMLEMGIRKPEDVLTDHVIPDWKSMLGII